MKILTLILVCIFLLSQRVHGQGTFVYDQQSATESTGGGGTVVIQANQPLGQSFTPTLTSIGFIRLFVGDTTLNGLGATLVVNVRANSITGAILGTSDAVAMPDGFFGYPNFFFPTPVAVTPNDTYFFQPVLQSGDSTWAVVAYNAYNYSGGMGYANGLANPTIDLWFREGIIVPEPGAVALVLVGGGMLIWFRRKFP